jgi:hypothetical protein
MTCSLSRKLYVPLKDDPVSFAISLFLCLACMEQLENIVLHFLTCYILVAHSRKFNNLKRCFLYLIWYMKDPVDRFWICSVSYKLIITSLSLSSVTPIPIQNIPIFVTFNIISGRIVSAAICRVADCFLQATCLLSVRMKTVCTSEMLIFCQTTWCYIPEDGTVHSCLVLLRVGDFYLL